MSVKQIGNNVNPFRFKQFMIEQDQCAMKVGTDGVLLGAWVDVEGAGMILDIGTGSGIVPLMIAQRTPRAVLHAVEIHPPSAEQASENVARSPWKERIEVITDSIQNYAQVSDHRYDLIVSNPPFFTGGTFSSDEQKAFIRHTVKLPHNDLMAATRRLLLPHGRLCVILPLLEGLRFVEISRMNGFFCTRMTEVCTKPEKSVERLLLVFELREKPMVRDQLTVLEKDGTTYSAQFKAITSEFYVDM